MCYIRKVKNKVRQFIDHPSQVITIRLLAAYSNCKLCKKLKKPNYRAEEVYEPILEVKEEIKEENHKKAIGKMSSFHLAESLMRMSHQWVLSASFLHSGSQTERFSMMRNAQFVSKASLEETIDDSGCEVSENKEVYHAVKLGIQEFNQGQQLLEIQTTFSESLLCESLQELEKGNDQCLSDCFEISQSMIITDLES